MKGPEAGSSAGCGPMVRAARLNLTVLVYEGIAEFNPDCAPATGITRASLSSAEHENLGQAGAGNP
jgi:hypothetical protein